MPWWVVAGLVYGILRVINLAHAASRGRAAGYLARGYAHRSLARAMRRR